MCRGNCSSAAGLKEEGRRHRNSPVTQGEEEEEEHCSAALALGGKRPQYSLSWALIAGLPTLQDWCSSTSIHESDVDDGRRRRGRDTPADAHLRRVSAW
jgi:hypothetical protein